MQLRFSSLSMLFILLDKHTYRLRRIPPVLGITGSEIGSFVEAEVALVVGLNAHAVESAGNQTEAFGHRQQNILPDAEAFS